MSGSSPTHASIVDLWERFHGSRDPDARRLLLEHYQSLPRIIAAKLYGMRASPTLSFDDYLQYGRVGLMEAVDRYDHRRGASFESYSTHRIRGAILNGIARETEAGAQARARRGTQLDRIESLSLRARAEPQRATLEDLVEVTVGLALGVLLEETVESIDERPHANPYAATELQQLARLLRALVDELPDREREVIQEHYFANLEFQTIAERLQLTKGRISQLHGSALRRLKAMLDERPGLDRKL